MCHIGRDTHELAEDERALLGLLLADDILHARRVHAIAQRGDEREVRDAEQRVELVLLDDLVAARTYSSVQSRTIFRETARRDVCKRKGRKTY